MASSNVRAAAFDPHFERVLNVIQYGSEKDAISLFSTDQYSVNQEIEYVFDDRKLYKVTPLNWAVRYNKSSVCKYLLEHGARAYSNLVYEYYPLHEACCRGFDGVVTVFIESGIDLDRPTPVDLDTPLHIACMRGNIGCVHLLLRGNAGTSLQNRAGHTPLEAAVYHDQDDLTKLFAVYGITSSSSVPVTGLNTASFNASPSACAPTGNSSHYEVRRRHSLSSTPPKMLSTIQNSLLISKSNKRPGSVYTDETVSTLTSNGVTALRSRPYLHHGSSIDSFLPVTCTVSQPRACFGSVAVTTQLTTAQSDRLLLQTTSRPCYMPQISIASNNSANSTSPVERDGLGSIRQNTNAGYSLSQPASKCASLTNQTRVMASPMPTASLLSTTNQHCRLLNAQTSPGTEQSIEAGLPLATASKSTHQKTHNQREGSFQETPKQKCGRLKFPLYESSSSPDFMLNSRRCEAYRDRTQSYDNLLYQSKRTLTLPFVSAPIQAKTPSPSRERINLLSHFLYGSLDGHEPALTDVADDSRGNQSFAIVREIIEDAAKSVNLTPAHLESLVSLATPECSTLDASEWALESGVSNPLFTLLPLLNEQADKPVDALRELGINIDECPFDVRFGEPNDQYMSVVFKVQPSPSENHNHMSQMAQKQSRVLKVFVRVFNLRDPQESVLYHNLVAKRGTVSSCDSESSTHLNEISILQQLSDSIHPNITHLVSHFKANVTNQYDQFVQQARPSTSNAIYVTGHIADFVLLSSSSITLRQYFKGLEATSSYIPENKVLPILSQILLGTLHLNKNNLSHNAVHPDNMFVDSEDHNTVILANFNDAIRINVASHGSEEFSKAIRRLRSKMINKHNFCRVAPELREALEAIDSELGISEHKVQGLFQMSDSYSAVRTVYELFLGPTHTFIQDLDTKCYSYNHIPQLRNLSCLCNHLLKSLFTYIPTERLTALEGAVGCFVLLFGPNPAQVTSLKQCREWLLAETIELYMRPVLTDTQALEQTDSLSKLLCMYLTIANCSPSLVWDACVFFQSHPSCNSD